MDLSEQKSLAVQPLSAIVRECGYGNPNDPDDCVIGRAYTKVTGEAWCWHKDSARVFGIPIELSWQAEQLCFDRRSPAEIADYLQAQGF